MKKSLLIFFVIILSSCVGNDNLIYQLRMNMIEDQIRARGINDEFLLNVMSKVERHKFVPKMQQEFAYQDRPLPIGYRQTISQPYIVAFMTEKLDLDRNHTVLEIGTGSGYQAAILSELAGHVYTIEIIDELAQMAKNVLEDNGYQNITIKTGDGYKGWPEAAPFDRIIVTAAPLQIPKVLIEQLKPGGKMIIPVGENQLLQHLWIVNKDEKGVINKEKILPVRFVPMVKE